MRDNRLNAKARPAQNWQADQSDGSKAKGGMMRKWKLPTILVATAFGLIALLILEIVAPILSGEFPPCQDGTWSKEKQTCVPDPGLG